MYWVYLILFIIIILTPKVIQDGLWFFREEDFEALLIFCFGLFGFVLYLAKEKALLRTIQEKLHLQKRSNIITKDLAHSYSYIGEVNRKLDIVKDFIFHLPKDTAEAMVQEREETYRSIIESAKLLAKTDTVSLRFVNAGNRKIEKISEEGRNKTFTGFDAKKLLSVRKNFWEDGGYAIARSPIQARGMVAYLIFAKTSNFVEDVDIFQILASQALLLFCVEWYNANKRKNL